jgi:hypothetical protein
MQWNDIRNRLKKSDSVSNVQKQSVITDIKNSPLIDKEVKHADKTIRPVVGILILGLIVIVIIIALIMQSKKVMNVGPEIDTGLTRQEAKDAQEFLQQIPLKPLTPDERKMIQDLSTYDEKNEDAEQLTPAEKNN